MLIGIQKFHSCMAFCVCSLLFIGGSVATATELPEITKPHNAELAWVSNNINQNGMQLSIQAFRSPDSVDSVMGFYRSRWGNDAASAEGDKPGFVENEMGEWQVISQLRDKHNIVLQLKPSYEGGSEGFLSSAVKVTSSGQIHIDFPAPDGAERVSSSIVEENNTESQTLVYVTQDNISNTASFYRRKLKSQGWRMATSQQHDGMEFMMFNRKNEKCELVVSPFEGGATVIYVNKVESNV